MVDMNDHVISSSEEPSYHTLDIVDCAVSSAAILVDEDYQYQWSSENNYSFNQNIYHSNQLHDINCKKLQIEITIS